jgi:hypothetical protein
LRFDGAMITGRFGDTPAASECGDQRKADLLTAGIEPSLTALGA